MATMIRYEPWALHRDLANRFNWEVSRLLDRPNGADASTDTPAEWNPAVDIEEHADKFVLRADIPGVDPKSIELTLEKAVLTLSGARDKAPASENVETRRSERASGRFLRRFSLPDTVDSDSVSARGVNGVLEVVIPKRPAVQPRKIAVGH